MMQLSPFTKQTAHLTLAGLSNHCEQGRPIVALHGWLDNAASFEPVSKFLDVCRPFYALDLPGHGLSEHRPAGTSYHLVENILDLLAFIDVIVAANQSDGESQKVSLLGHSLGGIICCLAAAAAPERFDQIILLDSLGPLTDETKDVLPQLRKAVNKALQINSKVSVFPSKEIAIRARMAGVGKIGKEAASVLVDRGTKVVEGGITWTTDPKLLKPSFTRFSEAQVEAIFSGIACPVHLISGESGYFTNYPGLEKRLAYFKDVDHVTVSGGHHFHMDGDIKTTAELLNAYFSA